MNELQQLPSQALGNPNTLPMSNEPTLGQRRQRNDMAQFALQHEAARNEVNTPPGTYIGQDALEMTGLPSLARGIGHLRDQEPGQALPELAMGGLGVAGMFGAGGARTPRPRPPLRAALPELAAEAPRLPNAPARLPGRATDGSVLPIRPPQPIRQSMVGGSNDLAEAAGMRPQQAPPRTTEALDAGPAQNRTGVLGRLRGEQRYETDNAVATIRQRADGLRNLEWNLKDGSASFSLADRAAAEAEGIRAMREAFLADAAANPGASYYYEPATAALARRNRRMAEAAGFTVTQRGNGFVISREAGASPTRPPPRPRPPRRQQGTITSDPNGTPLQGLDTTPSVSDPVSMRMERARRLGFDTETPLYHGTDNSFNGFDVRAAGSGANAGLREDAIFLTDSPAVADSYLAGGYVRTENAAGNAADIGDGVSRWYGQGSQVMPVHVRDIDNLDQWDWGGGGYTPEDMARVIKEARDAGRSGVVLRNVRDPGILDTIGPVGNPRRPANLVVMFDGKNIRSRFAAFDPARSGSSDLLAGVTAGGLIGGGVLANSRPPPRRQQ